MSSWARRPSCSWPEDWLSTPRLFPTRQDHLLRQAEAQIASRERHIEPAELLALMRNNQTVLVMLDVRGESDYNLFHLVDAHMVSPNQIRGDWARGLPADAIKVVMSNGEEPANQAAQELMARGIRNVYILDGGINHWLDTFGAGAAPRSRDR